MYGTGRYPFWHGVRAYELLTQAEARGGLESMDDLRAVEPFLARCVLHAEYERAPDKLRHHIRAQVGEVTHHGESLTTWVGDAPWLRCIDEVLLSDWMSSHVLFERHTPDFAVNVPVVTPVVTHTPEPTEWIEIAFVDPAGEPVSNVGWTVELADGRVMNGATGRNGLFRTNSGPPGNARLTYQPNGLPALQQLSPPGFHTVRQGQDIVSIAWAYGHADWNTVWDDSQNGDARDAHKTPMVLLPGTRLFIPETDQAPTSYAMGQRHEVVIDPPLAKLEVQMRWAHGDPLADLGYALRYELGGEPVVVPDLRTDGDGWVRYELPLGVSVVHAVFPEAFLVRTFELRQLDPVGKEGAPELLGIQHRLNALGFACPTHGQLDAGTLDAVRDFKRDVMGADEPSDQLDQATLDQLTEECRA